MKLLGIILASSICATTFAQVDVALMDTGWARVRSAYSDPTTHGIYATFPKDCEPLANYADGILKDRQRYAKGVEDCPIVGGIALSMFVDRHAVTHDDNLKSEARWVAEGIRNLVFNHRWPGYPSRGLNPLDGKSIGALSSRDQVTHIAHGLWRWAKSPLANDDDRALASTTLVAVAEWMLRTIAKENDWSFGCADGTKDQRGVTKMRQTRPHEAARLASLYAATYDLTKNDRYRIALEEVLEEALADSEKFSQMTQDDLKYGVPDYALLQMSSSLEVLRGVLKDSAISRNVQDPKAISRIDVLLNQVATLAAKRDAENEKHSPWLCGAAERPLSMLMAPSFVFPENSRAKLFAEIERIPFSRAHATRIIELSAAYWRMK